MLAAIVLLLACQLVGEALRWLTGVPLPGAVIGMFLLLAWLAVRPRERPQLGQVSGWLIARLPALFLPAAVGLMTEGRILSRYGLAIAAATLVSTILTLAVTAAVFRLCAGTAEDRR